MNHIPEPINERASRAFKTFKNEVMGLYKWVKGEKESDKRPEESHEPEESFDPVELEQAFNRAYRSYRIKGRNRIDVDTSFDWIRQNLIDLISRKLIYLGSARVKTATWTRFTQFLEDDIGNIVGVSRVAKAFNSQMMDMFQGRNNRGDVCLHEDSD